MSYRYHGAKWPRSREKSGDAASPCFSSRNTPHETPTVQTSRLKSRTSGPTNFSFDLEGLRVYFRRVREWFSSFPVPTISTPATGVLPTTEPNNPSPLNRTNSISRTVVPSTVGAPGGSPLFSTASMLTTNIVHLVHGTDQACHRRRRPRKWLRGIRDRSSLPRCLATVPLMTLPPC